MRHWPRSSNHSCDAGVIADPEEHSCEELLALMLEDAKAGEDRLGFKAEIADGKVLVTYPMSTLVWTIG